MNKINAPSPSSGEVSVASSQASIYLDQNELREAARKLWRRRRLIFVVMAILVSVSTVSLFQIPPSYTASALIMIDPRSSKVVDLEAVLTGASRDTEAIFSEAEVLSSRQLLSKVADKLELQKSPEFNGALRPPTLLQKLNPLNMLSSAWRSAVGGNPVPLTPEQQKEREHIALVNGLSGHIKIAPKTRTRVLSINVQSQSPVVAAQIANTLADLYIVDQLEAKFEATQRVTVWLNDRLAELRQKVDTADHAVEAYRASSGLIGGKGVTLVEQQISELSTQLTVARTERSAADSKLKQVRDAVSRPGGEEAVADLVDSQLIQHLREQESSIEHNIAEMSSQYGERHPKLISARAELEDIHGKIHSEVKKIVIALDNKANIARARENAVADQLELLKKQLINSNSSEVRLRALEMEATANRTLMETFLSRFKETSAQESGGIQTPDARIISRADVPQAPSFPKKGQFLIFATFISAVVGIALAFVAEYLDRGFRSGVQFEHETNIPVLALIPRLEETKGRAIDYLVERPMSALAEALRSIHTSLMLTRGSEPLRTIVVSSSQPSEGKTTLALCLMRMVASSGQSVVLVEADLRRPSVHVQLGIPRGIGLAEVLVGTAALQDVLYQDPKSSAHVLLAGKETLNPSKLIASHQMDDLLNHLAQKYDLVIIDTAPVLAVSDALLLANRADGTIFSCRWAVISRETAALGLKQLREANARVVGAVISVVDMKASKSYGYADTSYYYYAKKYYGE